MDHLPKKFSLRNRWLKKTLAIARSAPAELIASTTGISILIGLPVLSQSNYPPMVFFQPLAYPNYPQRNQQGDLVASLASNTDLENLVAEIEAAGLTEELKQGKFTLLAPNDKAFNALSDEAFDKFSQPEKRIKVLQYHLISGEVTQEDIDRGEITTLAGEAIAISQENNILKLNDAQVTSPSTVASNGVIIEIDKVLLPPGF